VYVTQRVVLFPFVSFPSIHTFFLTSRYSIVFLKILLLIFNIILYCTCSLQTIYSVLLFKYSQISTLPSVTSIHGQCPKFLIHTRHHPASSAQENGCAVGDGSTKCQTDKKTIYVASMVMYLHTYLRHKKFIAEAWVDLNHKYVYQLVLCHKYYFLYVCYAHTVKCCFSRGKKVIPKKRNLNKSRRLQSEPSAYNDS
jgi:hypothetical protein